MSYVSFVELIWEQIAYWVFYDETVNSNNIFKISELGLLDLIAVVWFQVLEFYIVAFLDFPVNLTIILLKAHEALIRKKTHTGKQEIGCILLL